MEERLSAFCFPKRGNMAPGSGGGGSTGTKCGRWNPTTEQVKVLTDLFRSGLRTPSTDQIQKISSELSFYGKIENKNVFYWFQNHKARERQKRRRVSIDEKDVLRREDNVLRRDDNVLRREDSFSQSARYFGGISDQFGDQQERVLETLQLFPLHSFDDADAEKLRFHGNDHCKETTAFSYTFNREMDHPPLDLRLSFL